MAQSPERVPWPSARGCHESVVVEDKMFVWGGGAASLSGYGMAVPCLSRLDLFSVNMLSEEWNSHTANSSETPPPCYGAAATYIGNKIYSHGGVIRWTHSAQPDEFVSDLYEMIIDEMRWRKVEIRGIKPTGRCGAAMCSVNGKLLLMGGVVNLPSESKHPQAEYKENICTDPKIKVNNGWNNELFEFDPQTGCWSPVCVTGSKPCPREGHTLTAVDEKTAVLFGGFAGKKCFNDLWLLDIQNKVWSFITPISPMWPLPRSHHTVCTMVFENGEVKALLLGGLADEKRVVSDGWMLDVRTGTGTKFTFDGEAFGRWGHSAGCVMLSDSTIAISAFGGYTTQYLPSAVSNPVFYQWNPNHAAVLRSGRPSVGAVLFARFSAFAFQTSEEMRELRKEVQHMTASIEQLQSQLAHTVQQKDKQLAQKDEQLAQKDEQLIQKDEQLAQERQKKQRLATANQSLTAGFEQSTLLVEHGVKDAQQREESDEADDYSKMDMKRKGDGPSGGSESKRFKSKSSSKTTPQDFD